MAISIAAGSLNVAWDGITPAVAPANSTVVLPVNEISAAGLEITGPFVGTVLLEATINGGVTWFAPNCLNIDKTAGSATRTVIGRQLIQLVGCTAVRARMSAYTSGAAGVTLSGSLAPV